MSIENKNILKRIEKLEVRLKNIESVVAEREIKNLHELEESLGMSKSKLPPFWDNQWYLSEKAKILRK